MNKKTTIIIFSSVLGVILIAIVLILVLTKNNVNSPQLKPNTDINYIAKDEIKNINNNIINNIVNNDTEKVVVAKYTGEISSNWESMQLAFDGNLYTLPFDYQNLVDIGWKSNDIIKYYSSVELNQNQMLVGPIALENKNKKIEVGFINLNKETTALVKSKVSTVNIKYDADNRVDVLLPGKITWKSTYEDIINVCGEPYSSSKHDILNKKFTYLEYFNKDKSKHLDFYIYEDGGMTGFSYSVYVVI